MAARQVNQTGNSICALSWFGAALMYMFTSDTVMPLDKMEFFWRSLAGPFNFLPGL